MTRASASRFSCSVACARCLRPREKCCSTHRQVGESSIVPRSETVRRDIGHATDRVANLECVVLVPNMPPRPATGRQDRDVPRDLGGAARQVVAADGADRRMYDRRFRGITGLHHACRARGPPRGCPASERARRFASGPPSLQAVGQHNAFGRRLDRPVSPPIACRRADRMFRAGWARPPSRAR